MGPLVCWPPMSEEKLSFESSVKELEKIVSELERGELPLESQLKTFERGVGLARESLKKLEEIEKRVELLTKNADGQIATSSFDVS